MKKIIILSLIILFCLKTQKVFANQDTFVVDNIEIKGEITNNKIIDRQKFLNIGFKKGFKNLSISLLKREDQKKILSTDLENIKLLIENYSVQEEKITEEKYYLKISIVFNKEKTLQFFYKNNVPYSVTNKLEIIVYPIFIHNSDLKIFSENKFFEEWNNDNKNFKNINFILPLENIDDINFIKENIDELEETDLNRLVDNYEIKNSTILILRYYEKELNIFLKSNLSGKKKINNLDVKVDNLDSADVRADIIRNLKLFINDIWKEENLVDISIPSYLNVIAKINGPNQLMKITKKLKEIGFIENYTVEEVNTNFAKIKIKYLGNINNLQNSFFENGFDVKIDHNQWTVNLF